MNYNQFILLLSTCPALLLSSCASIVSKSDWPLTISSNPSGANLKIKDKKGREIYNGTTPTTLNLTSSAGFFQPARYDLEASLSGYNSSQGTIAGRMNGWYVGNILFGGVIGILIVDPATGAMWKLPESHVLNLTKLSGVTATLPIQKSKPQIVSINDIPQHLRKNLIAVD